MTDEEYEQLLVALARKHLRPRNLRRGPMGDDELRYTMDQLSSIARLNRVVAERPDSIELVHQLARELRHAPVGHAAYLMEEAGVVTALEELPDVVFQNLRRSAIPEEDLQFLHDAGVADPEAELTILIHYARKHLGRGDSRPSSVLSEAQPQLQRAASILENLASVPEKLEQPKKRKIFNGIGKILAGAATGVGNTLLACGTIAAPNPATAYAVIGSAAIALGSIGQGIGDLRGE